MLCSAAVRRLALSSSSLSRTRLVVATATSLPSSPSFTSSSIRLAAAPQPLFKNKTRFLSTAAVEQQQQPATDIIDDTPFVATPDRKYQFFQNVELTDSGGVAIIRFDGPKPGVNTISFALAAEAQELWKQDIENNNDVKAVVFASAKPDMFIAGADIFDIQQLENKQDVIPIIKDGLEFFQNMKTKGVPLVAAIDGPALGGGLEWALWCDSRICSDSPKTKLGLPEVKLGLLPGFGGTQNLPKLVGLQAALDMMLTGKEIRPAKAKKMGLVDLVVAPQSLEQVAIDQALGLANGTVKVKKKSKSFVNRLLEDNALGQRVIWNQVEKMVQKNTNGNYPAPFAIIESVKKGLEEKPPAFQYEREAFAKLAATPESEALIGIFNGMTSLKKHSYGKDAALPVSHVAVMGAGLMGAGIAQVSADNKGKYEVLLKDRNDQAVGRGVSYMSDNWGKKLKRKQMTQYQYNTNLSRVTPLTDDTSSWKRHFGRANLVIEAVFEDLDLKRNIVAEVESLTSDSTIFATNTSAIPIRDIAAQAQRPQNIIGMHYFSPVPSMPLLEIIPHDKTSTQAIATAYEVGAAQGKTCIVVKDVPGFYVNRCLGPYLMEVSALVKDGVGLEQLDKSMTNFGMPVGPITLADEVGIDVASHVATFLSEADLGTRMHGGDVSLMQNMIQKGWLGKKSGQGFYTYNGTKKKKTISPEVQEYVNQFASSGANKRKLSEEDIQNRIITRFVNEAAKCLEDDIIESPVVGDIGLVFGTGFAPFRGGPFFYLDQIGVPTFVDTMKRFQEEYGIQFEPCQLLQDYAKSGKKFHK